MRLLDYISTKSVQVYRPDAYEGRKSVCQTYYYIKSGI